MGSILAIIKVIADIFAFIKWAKVAWGEKELNNWLGTLSTTIRGMTNAKTPEEKSKVAQSMVDLIHGIPSSRGV